MICRDGFAYAPQSPNYISGNISNWKHPWDIEKLKYTAWKLDDLLGDASCDIVSDAPLHAATPHSMKNFISIMCIRMVLLNLINEGYWVIPVRKREI